MLFSGSAAFYRVAIFKMQFGTQTSGKYKKKKKERKFRNFVRATGTSCEVADNKNICILHDTSKTWTNCNNSQLFLPLRINLSVLSSKSKNNLKKVQSIIFISVPHRSINKTA